MQRRVGLDKLIVNILNECLYEAAVPMMLTWFVRASFLMRIYERTELPRLSLFVESL